MQRRWRGAAPGIFAVRWFGFLAVDRPGRYTFSVSSDDGAVLAIDGVTTIDNGGRHGLQTQAATIALDAGAHSVVIDFTQAAGTFAFEWSGGREGEVLRPLPPWALTPQKENVQGLRAARAAAAAARALAWLAAILAGVLAWQERRWIAAHPRPASLVFFAALAVVHTWPLASDLAHLTRHDNRDAILNEWIVAWVARELPRAPLHLFDGNIFHPERYTLAFSEPMVVQGILAMPLRGLGASVVLTYNLLLLAGMILSGWTMTLVVQRWTRDWTAALIAGSIFAFNAHSLSRIPHLQAQHLEFLPLALCALDRLLAVPARRQALGLAGWFVLQSLTSIYLLVFTSFALIAAAVARLDDVRARPAVTLRWLLVAALVSIAVLTPFLIPYWFVSRDLGLVRTVGDASNFAATWSAYLSTPARVHAWWSARFAEGNVLFPGALALLLALVALLRGVAFTDRRARMCLAVGVAGVALSFGAQLPGYGVLYAAMPLLRGIRATARFGVLAICGVAMLAGFGAAALRVAVAPRAWRVVSVVLIGMASLEPLAAPLGLTRFDAVPPIYALVPRTPGTVVLELPFFGPRSVQFHAHYMLNSTEHWQPLVNGYSGFQPPSFYDNAEALQTFPGGAAFARMRALGVTHVFIHADQMPDGTLAAMDARADFERVATFGAIVLYRTR
ncbi:MAG TPA: PA14 domain-containing protein [Vicinamibacterales bacterium]|nr:PA14 domain-containing protein [Vicinamibacterales bacterium]